MRAISSAMIRPLTGNPALLRVLAAAGIVDGLTIFVVVAYGNSYLLKELNAPSSYPGYELAIYGLVKLATAPVGGWLLHRRGPWLLAALGATAAVAGLVLILATGTAEGFLAGVALFSTGIALWWLIVYHAAGHGVRPEDRGTAMAYMSLVSISGSACGAAAAALASYTTGHQVAFSAALAVSAGAAILLLTLGRTSEHAVLPGKAAIEPVAGVARRPQFPAMCVIFAHFVLISAALGVFGPFFLRTLDLRLIDAGRYLLPAGAAAAGAMVWAGRRSTHGHRLREAFLLYAIAAVSMAIAAPLHSPALFAVVAVPMAAALLATFPLVNAGLVDTTQAADRAGVTLGWLFFAEGLGSVAGPAVAAVVIEAAGVRAGVVAVSILAAGLALLTVAANRRRWL